MGHYAVGRLWDRMAMDLLDLSITSAKKNRYVLMMVDCFSRWTEACPLPDKTALSVADAFFQYVVCHFRMPSVIHSDQGWISRIKSCKNCVFFVVYIKPGQRHIIRRVMAWWNVSI